VVRAVDLVIEDLHHAEEQLRLDLQRLGERHAADHEVAHVTRDLARWSASHVEKLASEGRRFGLDLDPTAPSTNPVAAGVRRKSSAMMGRRHTPAVMLVEDLRTLYGEASMVKLDWELLTQLAMATGDQALLQLARRCQGETERQVVWAESKLKESAAQALATP
jgi:hypothetical protein